jgi:hypothetical protein
VRFDDRAPARAIFKPRQRFFTKRDQQQSQCVIRVEEEQLRSHVGEVVRQTVEQTLNGLLEAQADELCGASVMIE